MNLRLDPELEVTLRAASERDGQSQQEIIRRALGAYLAVAVPTPTSDDPYAELIAAGIIKPPRRPYATPRFRLTLPEGVSTADLLDRDDRL